jgi:hypothetical protein
MLKFKYKDSDEVIRQEMLSEVISQYQVKDRSQLVMALAHCQTVYGNSMEDFSNNPAIDVTLRSVTNYKKEYLELYNETFEKYMQDVKPLDVEIEMDDDILEQVYLNMMAKLSNPSTSAKDLSLLLSYFNISSTELKQYAKLRGASLKGFIADNEKQLIKDEDTASLVKAVLAESDYLYLGSEKTVGHTASYMEMDLDEPLVRLECQAIGSLMMGLWNGAISPQTIEMLQTLRVLKLVAGEKLDTKQSVKEFEADGKPKKLKPVTEKMQKDLIDIFGREQGLEMYNQLLNAKAEVATKTAITLPRYEAVESDYNKQLKVFTSLENMPLDVFLSKLDAQADKQYKEKYKQYLTTEEEK